MSHETGRFTFVPLDPHADCRGWVINPFDFLPPGTGVSNCHIFSVAPGARRGNHAHEERDESVAVLSGTLLARDPGSDEEVELSPDSPGLLRIPPGVPHVFENRGDAIAVAICFSTVEPDPASGVGDRGGAEQGSVSLR